MSSTKIIVIAGPTASGKSGLAFELAQQTNGIIINADSMQVYKDIPILAATPSQEEQKQIPHKLYGIYEADVRGNVVDWLNLCKEEIADAQQKNLTPIIVGGTGMYIESLTKGVTPIPETPKKIRDNITELLQTKGLNYLYQILEEKDNLTAQRLSPNDTTRIRRAVEVLYHTKKPLSYWHTVPLITSYAPQDFITVYINPLREELDNRCRQRFDKMIEEGALEEVKNLIHKNLSDSLPAMRALGVQELKAYLNGNCSLEEAIEQAKLHTRQYAKRQSTWFNNRFTANFELNNCFKNNKNFVDDIKKAL